jgi:hypothetical protein
MKKFPFMLLLVGLLIATVFVFASNRKLANSLDLYADKGGGNYVQITSGAQSFNELTTVPGAGSPTQASITDRNNNAYPIVAGVNKMPVYSVTSW